MTLTALLTNLNLECPSLRIDNGEARKRVITQIMELQSTGSLFCPHCYESGQGLVPVRFRNTQAKRVHFFHASNSAGMCVNWSNESERHKLCKFLRAKQLQEIHGSLAEVKLEHQFKATDRGSKRRPDIWVKDLHGKTHVHEIQFSRISDEEVKRRSDDLRREHGCSTVTWYFGGNAHCQDLLDACQEWRIPHQVIFFEDDMPRFEPVELRRQILPRDSPGSRRLAPGITVGHGHSLDSILKNADRAIAMLLGPR